RRKSPRGALAGRSVPGDDAASDGIRRAGEEPVEERQDKGGAGAADLYQDGADVPGTELGGQARAERLGLGGRDPLAQVDEYLGERRLAWRDHEATARRLVPQAGRDLPEHRVGVVVRGKRVGDDDAPRRDPVAHDGGRE